MRRAAFFLFCGALVTVASGRTTNYCLDLDGKSAGAQIEWLEGLQTMNGARQYTFEAWVRPRTQGGGGRGRILDQEQSSLTFYLSDEGRVGFRPNRETGWQLSEKNAVTFWKWQHVAVTSDGKLLRFFVNGKLLSATPVDPVLSVTRKPLWVGNGIGEDSTKRGFDGWLDDIRVSNACRWKSDFKVPIHGTSVLPDSATILLMNFDEGPAYDIALDYSAYNTELRIAPPLARVKAP